MKKFQDYYERIPFGLLSKKTIRVMKLTLFLSMFTILQLWATESYSQLTKVTLKLEDVKISDALKEIENQSEFFFLYSPKLIDVERKVNIDAEKEPIKKILSNIFGEKVIFAVYDRQVILSPIEQSGKLSVVQQRSITGTVTEKDGTPIPGVNVVVTGTTQGTTTDIAGRYSIEIPIGANSLNFSFIGMASQEISIGTLTQIDVTLVESEIGLEEVVVIGYGSLSKKELSSSIVNITRERFIETAVTNPMELIIGKVTGLNINATAPANPNSSPSLQIRGATSLSAGNDPLIVINGVPGATMNMISPQDVETITVLKDGASAAIYGTRGANGVILITTKKGIAGADKFSVTYDSWIGINYQNNIPRVLTAEEFRKYERGFDYGGKTDWYKETHNTFGYDHNQYLSFMGSSEKGWYKVSLNYKNGKGLGKGNERWEYGGRFDVMQKTLNDRVELTGSLNLRKVKIDQRDYNNYWSIVTKNPTIPVYDEDGNYFHTGLPGAVDNLIEELNEKANFSDLLNMITSAGFKVHILQNENQNLNTSLNFSYDYHTNDNQQYRNSSLTTLQYDYRGSASLSNSLSANRTMEWLINYILNIDDHNVRFVGGYSYQDFTYTYRSMTNKNFSNDDFLYNTIGSGNYLPNGLADMSSDKSLHKLIGLFGRVNYNYNDLIMASASLRYEGSTKFGENNKWGYFPAASVAWEIANMDFVKDRIDIINSLKLRFSYGITGRSGFDSYKSLTTYGPSNYYFMNNQWITTFAPNRNPNPNLKWEKGISSNIGLDFALWSGRLNGSVDLFDRTSKDLLYNYTAPQPPMIFSDILVNVGTIQNRGIELMINGDAVRTSNFSWNTGIVFSTGKTHLTRLSDEVYNVAYLDMYLVGTGDKDFVFRYEEGTEIGQFYGYRHAGISEDGRLQVYDNDGNKIYKGLEIPEYKSYLGRGVPRAFFSWANTLRYKNFDLNLLFRGAAGFEIANFRDYKFGFQGVGAENVLLSAYKGDNADFTGDPRIWSDFHLHKGDYVKLENASLGYTLEMQGKYFERLRMYISGKNLFIITTYNGSDPSSVDVNGLTPGIESDDSYPPAAQLTLGVTFNF